MEGGRAFAGGWFDGVLDGGDTVGFVRIWLRWAGGVRFGMTLLVGGGGGDVFAL